MKQRGDDLTAKEYLQQIRQMDTRINNKLVERYQLDCLRKNITSSLDKEPRGSGGVTDKVGNITAKLLDLEEQINHMIDDFVDQKQQCIDLIDKIPDHLQYTVLHKHYVQYKPLVDIAEEENYTYQYIIEIHAKALTTFENLWKPILKV